MKFTSSIIAAATLAVASAQFTTSADGTITCATANGTYCAGDSGSTNIIIRCANFVGTAGNCNDNLAGDYPAGDNYSPCFSCGTNSPDSACSKDGIVYPQSGTGLGISPFYANDTSICAAISGSSSNSTGTNGTTASMGTASPSGTGAPVYTSSNGTYTVGPASQATGTGVVGPSPTPTSTYSAGPVYTGAASSVRSGEAAFGLGALLVAAAFL